MVASIIIALIVIVIALVIYKEYRNEKRYQEERRKQREKRERKLSPKVTKRAPPPPVRETSVPTRTPVSEKHPKTETSEKRSAPEKEKTVKPDESVTKQEEKKRNETVREVTRNEPKTETIRNEAAETPQKPKPSVELPKGEYPEFNYDRLIEMGLSEEEALAFIHELIPQIAEQIPLIDEALKIPDFHKMERLTHSIKGSSTTIGTGGVSDLLVEYNTYLKTGEEIPVAEAYQALLKKYFEKLKKQFPEEN